MSLVRTLHKKASERVLNEGSPPSERSKRDEIVTANEGSPTPEPSESVEIDVAQASEVSPTSNRSERSELVTFDVGGRTFKVLKEPTLSLFPESLLNTLAEQSQGDEPIFVEANPDLFPYMLDYHRHRKIAIPYTVSKEAVLREASVLGLDVKPEDIQREELPWHVAAREGAISIAAAEKDLFAQYEAFLSKLWANTTAVIAWKRIKETGTWNGHVEVKMNEVSRHIAERTGWSRFPSDYQGDVRFAGCGLKLESTNDGVVMKVHLLS